MNETHCVEMLESSFPCNTHLCFATQFNSGCTVFLKRLYMFTDCNLSVLINVIYVSIKHL